MRLAIHLRSFDWWAISAAKVIFLMELFIIFATLRFLFLLYDDYSKLLIGLLAKLDVKGILSVTNKPSNKTKYSSLI